MYQDTITLFCRRESRRGDTWYPKILTGVNLNIDRAAIVAKYGEQSADNASLHIKYQTKSGSIYVGDKKYLPPKEWDAQEETDLADTLTFSPGANFDFFIVGEWENTEPISDSSFTDGFYDYMQNRFDYCFAITSVTQLSVIPHFEIMAK